MDQAQATVRAGMAVVRCARRRRTSLSVTGMRPLPGLWGGRRRDAQVGVRQHGEGDVPVPGVVAADLILVKAGLVLGGLVALLDGPAGPGARRGTGRRIESRASAPPMLCQRLLPGVP